jgi:hypothetical protein
MKRWWPLCVWGLLAGWMWWWLGANPLPDGYQNEYLHLGNALDLWEALQRWDVWHLRWYMYTYYWPWGFYAVPWPLMGLLGAGRLALVSGNLVHLGVLLWATAKMGRTLQAPLAPLLVALCPGVFGCLVRFEPNLADIAWTTAGVALLLDSRRLRDVRAVIGWGVCLGIGLMMDRLSVLFFLVPAVLPLLWPLSRRALRNVGLGLVAALLLSAAYYREFFLRHTSELLSQAPLGEIDAAGAVSIGGGWLYYPLALVDSQAGPVIGALMLWGLGAAAVRCWRRRDDPSAVILAAVLPAVIFFTLISKQQAYYTLPILGPLAVLAAGRGHVAWLGGLGGLWSLLAVGVGVVPGGPWLPEDWVAPRHVLARPPSWQSWPLDEALAVLDAAPDAQLLVLSEDSTLFEGFVVLAVREAWPGRSVRGVTLDPVGSHELLSEIDGFVWVGDVGARWPTARQIRLELVLDHMDMSSLPPIDEALAEAADSFTEVGRWPAGDREMVVFVAREAAP